MNTTVIEKGKAFSMSVTGLISANYEAYFDAIWVVINTTTAGTSLIPKLITYDANGNLITAVTGPTISATGLAGLSFGGPYTVGVKQTTDGFLGEQFALYAACTGTFVFDYSIIGRVR